MIFPKIPKSYSDHVVNEFDRRTTPSPHFIWAKITLGNNASDGYLGVATPRV